MPARISRDDLQGDALEALEHALDQAGYQVRRGSPRSIEVDGTSGPLSLEVVPASVVDGTRVEAVIDKARRSRTAVVVADQILSNAVERLDASHIDYFDRRGRLRINRRGLRVDAEAAPRPRRRSNPPAVFGGQVAIGTALWLLMHPDEPHGVRALARSIGAAPSTVQVAFDRLKRAALVDPEGKPLCSELFWALAEEWHPEPVAVGRAPSPRATGRGSVDRPVLAGDSAAAAWGAPLALTSDAPVDLYVQGAERSAWLKDLGGPVRARESRATLAAAPAGVVMTSAMANAARSEWALAHPVVAALDLARDRSRGREILAEWDPPPEFTRVW